jgi:hypothetical protein
MHLFLWQILHGHTAGRHLSHQSGLRFTAAAYGQARARLPLRCFDLLLEHFSSAVPRSALDDGQWQGHRPCRVDGSGGSIPDTPALQDTCGQSTRSDGVRPRLSPRASGHVPLRHAPPHRRGADQRSGCAAVAQRAKHRDPWRRVDRQPHPTASSGAARQETAAQKLPMYSQIPARTASAVGPARAQRLTSYHSRKTPY